MILVSYFALLVILAAGPSPAATLGGAILETIAKDSLGEKAGFQAADVILSWSRAAPPGMNAVGAKGRIEWPFDLDEVEVEQAPRGEVTLYGLRGREKMTWILPRGAWDFDTRPALSTELLSLHQKAIDFAESKNLKEAATVWREAAAKSARTANTRITIWLLRRAGVAAASAREWPEANSAFDAAISLSTKNALDLPSAFLLRKSGEALRRQSQWDQSETCYNKALALDRKHDPQALGVAADLHGLNNVKFRRGELIAAQDIAQQAIAIQEKFAPDTLELASSLNDLGVVAMNRGDLTLADVSFRRALPIKEKLAPGSSTVSATLSNLGLIALSLSHLGEAEAYFKRCLAIDEKRDPDSLDVADTLSDLGRVALDRGDVVAAEQYEKRALATHEKLDPDGVLVARSLLQLGNIELGRNNLDGAAEYYRRSLDLENKLRPGGAEVGALWHNLGAVEFQRGDLTSAEALFQQSLAVSKKLGPVSLGTARDLSALALVAHDRGDLVTAEEYMRRALAIEEQVSPDGLDVAGTLVNFGALARIRQDSEAEANYARRAIEIYEKRAPGNTDMLKAINNLGLALEDQGDLDAAESNFRRTLDAYEKLNPGSNEHARSMGFLADLALRRGDLSKAENLYRQSADVREKLAPGSLDYASDIFRLGEVEFRRKNYTGAEEFYRQAHAIYKRLSPNTTDEAIALHAIGKTLAELNQPDAAADTLCSAVNSLEAQQRKLGGTQETQTLFRGRYTFFYQDCIAAQFQRNRTGEAFQLLERERARTLLEMLAERDLLFASDLPQQLAIERRRASLDYDSTQNRIGALNPAKDATEIESLLGHLREVRAQQEEIVSRIRAASPRLASLQYPQPLDVAGVRRVLDPGTALLAYAIGEKSFLFVVQPEADGAAGPQGLTAFQLPIDEKALREKVQTFRNLVERNLPADLPAIWKQGADLYDLLIGPAESLLASSQRILISPDGPLHTLPFAALVRKENRGKKRESSHYLVEWKPLHTIVSSTVYAEIEKARRPTGSPVDMHLVAFGDPNYPTLRNEKLDQSNNAELRAAVTRGMRLVALPSTRIEVNSISELFASSSVKYLGREATEEHAKAVGKDVRFLHFAVHGILDERFPLNSALVLAIPDQIAPGQDNGLLQAWEILEQMRLDADLVTLSACDTALGKESGGEGLVGLARAFQYAGARSIVASLWSVSDESTAELMKHFYGYLRAGKTKDEALRLAQIDMVRLAGGVSDKKTTGGPSAAHPFHWAAFELIGDWK